jgi:hypothetical protein
MIPNQTFSCPHCGAPGQVNMGQAEYSCTCRFAHVPPPLSSPWLFPAFGGYDCVYPSAGPREGTGCPSASRIIEEERP